MTVTTYCVNTMMFQEFNLMVEKLQLEQMDAFEIMNQVLACQNYTLKSQSQDQPDHHFDFATCDH